MKFETLQQWHSHVRKNWDTLKTQADEMELDNAYRTLMAIVLGPVMPTSADDAQALLQLLEREDAGVSVQHVLRKDLSRSITLVTLIDEVYQATADDIADWGDLDRLILVTGGLSGIGGSSKKNAAFSREVLKYFRDVDRRPSAVRVQTELISAGQNVVIAGRDVNIVTDYNWGDEKALKAYLAEMRAEWNYLDFGQILPDMHPQVGSWLRLHRLYTPLDIWSREFYDKASEEELSETRYRAIEHDLATLRSSALEAVVIEPYLVLTGGAGTGKSTLSRFIATCLAYACDPAAEKADNVNGLALLGDVWVHGAILPLYVNARDFCTDEDSFPAKPTDANASTLMKYLSKRFQKFMPHLEKYLTDASLPIRGTILFIDGLDEVYEEDQRTRLKRIVESWLSNYPNCRILVTSRDYAYRKSAKWRFSKHFKHVELAPYTWRQMHTYVQNWYGLAAVMRPASLGGREYAEFRSEQLVKNLITTILHT
ncbi:MAG: hypothetical protein H7Y09_04980, partial [Chitinophagaceae bacterium]|nr:hypothetical protein [Anaerolineae bacterium]